jgi:hypothetical protein
MYGYPALFFLLFFLLPLLFSSLLLFIFSFLQFVTPFGEFILALIFSITLFILSHGFTPVNGGRMGRGREGRGGRSLQKRTCLLAFSSCADFSWRHLGSVVWCSYVWCVGIHHTTMIHKVFILLLALVAVCKG